MLISLVYVFPIVLVVINSFKKKAYISRKPFAVPTGKMYVGLDKSYSMESGYAMTRKLMDSGKEFTAIFALSDTMAVGACRAIFEEGKNVPRDYSVAGFDGIELCSYYNPTLTTIRQPVQDIAEESVKLLFDILAGGSGHQHKIFPGVLLEQESTRKI